MPERLTLDLAHLRFEALAWGPQDGRLALCLHGYPDSAWTWRGVGPALAAQGFRVVAPFTRGYAPTELARDGDYHVGALMYDAVELHEHLGGGDDAVLIGHDWGGLTAAGLAAYSKCPFSKLVVMGVPLLAGVDGTVGDRGDVLRLLPAQARKSWYTVYQQLPWLSERTLNRVIPRLWRDWCPRGYDSSEDLARVWESLPDVAHRRAALSYYRAAFRPGKTDERYRELDALWQTAPRHPMLLMHGRLDGAIDWRLGELGARALPAGSRHEIIELAGHFMHLDQQDRVLDLILDYIG